MQKEESFMVWLALIRREVDRSNLTQPEREMIHVRIDNLPWAMIERAYEQGVEKTVAGLLTYCESKIGRNYTLELYHELIAKNNRLLYPKAS